MSARFLIHILLLAVAAILFVMIPEQHFARTPELAGDSFFGGDEEGEVEDQDPYGVGEVDGDFWEGFGKSGFGNSSESDWLGIRGRVYDLSGQPVPGLELVLPPQETANTTGLEGNGRDLSAVSQIDGSFEILVGGEPPPLRLVAKDWVLLGEWRRQPDEGLIESEVLVAEAVTVAGRVTTATGENVPARVSVFVSFPLPELLAKDGLAAGNGQFTLECETGPRGQFELGLVPRLPDTHITARTAAGNETTLPLPDYGPGEMHIVIDG